MEKAFKGDLCSDKLDSLDQLNKHIERRHKNYRDSKKTNFKCNMCGYQFRKGQDLITHMRTHTGERPFKCQVSGGAMAFKQESALKVHIKFKHRSEDRPFTCDFPSCLYATKTASNLKRHRTLHSDERPFACSHSGCNFRAKRKNNLSRHTASVHRESKTLTCSKCNYNANIASNLARHMIVHEGQNENVPCSIEDCEFKAKNSRALKDHMRRHETLLPCPLSGYSQYSATKEALKNHLQLHNPSGRAFQCPLCFKNFTMLKLLQQHSTVHTNEKPCQCGHCEFAAARQPDIKRHISSVHAAIEFPFIIHLLDDLECLRCKVTLPSAEFVAHCKSHVKPALIT